MRKYVIANCVRGLGNRLKCLVSAMRIANKISGQLILCWEKDEFVKCNFSDLFDNKIEEMTSRQYNLLCKQKASADQYEIIDTWRLLLLPEDDLPENFSSAYPSDTGTGRNIDLEYNRIPSKVVEKYLIYFRQLKPNKSIMDRVNRYASEHAGSAISVSVRSWKEALRRRFLFFNFAHVLSTMEKFVGENYFVSCDDDICLKNIIKRFGERVSFYPRSTKVGDSRSIEGMQEIVCELLLLSMNKRMIASYMSSFSEVAWWFGGCRAVVSIIPPRKWFSKSLDFKIHRTVYKLQRSKYLNRVNRTLFAGRG